MAATTIALGVLDIEWQLVKALFRAAVRSQTPPRRNRDGFTVRVRGYKEFMRAMGGVSGDMPKAIRGAIKEVAEPVRQGASARAAQWGPKTASGYRVSVSGRGAFVRQSRRKTTGQHPSFGGLQMREALLPALEGREAELEREMWKAIDRTLRRHGF